MRKVTSEDLRAMDSQLFDLIVGSDVSPELYRLINSMCDYLNLAAHSMARLEKENQVLNSCAIEINIG